MPGTYPRTPVRPLSNPTLAIPEFRRLPVPVLHGGRFGFFRGLGGEAISPIFGDCPINDRAAVDAFPGIEGQEKIRESFQHHQSFTLRTIHNFLPCEVNECRQGDSNLRSRLTAKQNQQLRDVRTTYTYKSVRPVSFKFSILCSTATFGENEDGMTSKRRVRIRRGVILTHPGQRPALEKRLSGVRVP